MIICGFSMEMELSEMCGTVGKCRGCHYFSRNDGVLSCEKTGKLNAEKEACKDWIVNHR